jgi:transcriptional regulator with XRE-family HTH domain
MVAMEGLASRLKEARSRHRMSLETASGAAKISSAYLHKLEAGRVQTPSPHVLRRLATVLEIPYLDLMALAGYLDGPETAVTAKAPDKGDRGRKGRPMSPSTTKGVPTNAEIVRLLQAVQAEIRELKRGQDDLAKKLGKASLGKTGR